MPHFDVHGLHNDGRPLKQPLEADDRVQADALFRKAWPMATALSVCETAQDGQGVIEHTVAGYEELSGEVLFEDDDFTTDFDGDSGVLLKRRVDTTAEDAR